MKDYEVALKMLRRHKSDKANKLKKHMEESHDAWMDRAQLSAQEPSTTCRNVCVDNEDDGTEEVYDFSMG